jgi:hypothetical protein
MSGLQFAEALACCENEICPRHARASSVVEEPQVLRTRVEHFVLFGRTIDGHSLAKRISALHRRRLASEREGFTGRILIKSLSANAKM